MNTKNITIARTSFTRLALSTLLLGAVACGGSDSSESTLPEFTPTTAVETEPLAASNADSDIDPQATVWFGFDSFELDESTKTELRGVASWTKEADDRIIVLEGHTDEIGDKQYNESLSAQRAAAVRSYLLSEGVAEERVQTRAFGEEQADLPEDRMNRRVLVYATSKDAPEDSAPL
tara:strand:+ start:32296 stop:32826 length:531 start_codon:yes stop_codon:yes gene_type:complete